MPDWLREALTSDWVGWFATALFAVSYIVHKQLHLLYVQVVAASVWIVYGLAQGTHPVVLANVIVAGSAAFKAFRMKTGAQPLH